MRVLIYSYCYVSPHLETDLEIAKRYIDHGHDVFFLTCNKELSTCFINPNHRNSICQVCTSKIKKGINFINIPEENRFSFLDDNKQGDFNEITSIQELKKTRYKGFNIGLGVYSSLVSQLRDHEFDVSKNQELINKGLNSAVLVYETFDSLLENYTFDLLVFFNGRFLEVRPILHLCEKNNIAFVTHERGGNIDRFLLSSNSTPHSLAKIKNDINDYWSKGEDDKYVIGNKFFIERKSGIVQNWLAFTSTQQKDFLPENFNHKKINVVIFNSSIDEYVSIPDFETKIYKSDNEGIGKLCASFKQDSNYQFYLRNHPNLANLKNTQVNQIELLKQKHPNLIVIDSTASVDSYKLMEVADLVISFGSTAGAEAVYWGTHTLLLGRAFYEDLEGFLKPQTHEEVCFMIRNIDNYKLNNSGAIKFGYWSMVYGEEFKYFKPNGLFGGKFLGKTLKSDFITRLKLKISNLFE
jgi:hypothetical protein